MDAPEIISFVRITNALADLHPRLMQYAATTAVNFFKERIVLGRDINDIPFKKRKESTWRVARKRDSKGGRNILVDSGTLKRDIQKIEVGVDHAIIGTTKISAPYAKAHNEGFKGTVTQNVKAFERKRKTGGTSTVKAFTRRIKQNIPQRQFMGTSALLDTRIAESITNLIIDTVKKAST